MKNYIIFNLPNNINKNVKKAWPNAQVVKNCSQNTEPADVAILWAGSDDLLGNIACCVQKDCKVLVLSDKGNLGELQTAIAAGAKGYIDSNTDVFTLQVAANSIKQGGLWIPSELLNNLVGLINKTLPESSSDPFDVLTPRELETVKAVREGLSNKEVAKKLEITERTVKQHLSSSFSKLGVKDRIQLALLGR